MLYVIHSVRYAILVISINDARYARPNFILLHNFVAGDVHLLTALERKGLNDKTLYD